MKRYVVVQFEPVFAAFIINLLNNFYEIWIIMQFYNYCYQRKSCLKLRERTVIWVVKKINYDDAFPLSW